jgi:hypothetical protein
LTQDPGLDHAEVLLAVLGKDLRDLETCVLNNGLVQIHKTQAEGLGKWGA